MASSTGVVSRTGRPVDLVSLEAAQADPLLLDAVLRGGRVLVDRDGEWPAMLAEQARVARVAELAAGRLRRAPCARGRAH